MNTKNNRKKSIIAALGAATAAIAAPALLFTGAGAAQAATSVNPEVTRWASRSPPSTGSGPGASTPPSRGRMESR